MTDSLFHRDSYLRGFDASVISAQENAVVLDRTAFYPGGGGQPHDTGLISAGGRTLQVVEVRREGGNILHVVEGEELPEPGQPVLGELDWERRYSLMRVHTALHVLCGVVFREFGALVTGGNMHPGHARMDFELEDLSPARVSRIEALANQAIADGMPVRVRILPREEAFQIPDLIRTKINLLPAGITEVRTVEIVGLDLQADGGTHVANTREVGGIQVLGTRSKGKIFKRIEIGLLDSPLVS